MGVGFCYNFGCVVFVVFLVLVGKMSVLMLFGMVIGIDVVIVYLIVVVVVLMLFEMKGCDFVVVIV